MVGTAIGIGIWMYLANRATNDMLELGDALVGQGSVIIDELNEEAENLDYEIDYGDELSDADLNQEASNEETVQEGNGEENDPTSGCTNDQLSLIENCEELKSDNCEKCENCKAGYKTNWNNKKCKEE